jgi:uncharacterized membrane protein YfcA
MTLVAAVVVAILTLGSFVQGLTGFGLALVSVPLLSLVLDVKTAVPLAGLFGWLVTLPLVYAMRAHIRWREGLILFAASLPGTWLGAEALHSLPGGVIRLAMGLVLIASSLYALKARGPVIRAASLPLTLTAGFCSGALGGSVGEPGPPVIAYTSLAPWSADEAKSTLAFFFMLQMIGALASFYQKGLMTPQVLGLFPVALPGFVVGLGLGMAAYAVIRGRRLDFHKLVHGCLCAIGVVLIVKAAV